MHNKYNDSNKKYFSYGQNYSAERNQHKMHRQQLLHSLKNETIMGASKPKKLDPKKADARLKEAIKRLERCKFTWKRKVGIDMIKSIIEQMDENEIINNGILSKIKNVLIRFSCDEDKEISHSSQKLINIIEEKERK